MYNNDESSDSIVKNEQYCTETGVYSGKQNSLKSSFDNEFLVTVHTSLSREVFWHEYAKIPRHTSQNSIAAGNLE